MTTLANPDDLLDVRQVACLTSYSEAQIRRFIRSGKIEAVTVTDGGRKYFVRRSSMDEIFKPTAITYEQQLKHLTDQVASQAPTLSAESKERLRQLLA